MEGSACAAAVWAEEIGGGDERAGIGQGRAQLARYDSSADRLGQHIGYALIAGALDIGAAGEGGQREDRNHRIEHAGRAPGRQREGYAVNRLDRAIAENGGEGMTAQCFQRRRRRRHRDHAFQVEQAEGRAQDLHTVGAAAHKQHTRFPDIRHTTPRSGIPDGRIFAEPALNPG
jgi:hypothetical protein